MAAIAMTAMTACSTDSQNKVPDFYEEIHEVRNLTVAQMTISKMATVNDLDISQAKGPEECLEAVVNKFKIGDRVAAYSYNSYIEAYVDLSELSPEDISVDDKNKTLTIRIPDIKTRLAGRDSGIKEIHYRVTGLRSAIGEKERAILKERMNDALKKELSDNKMIETRLREEGRKKLVDFLVAMANAHDYKLITK